MRYQVVESFRLRTPQGEMGLKPVQIVNLSNTLAIKLIQKGRVTPLEPIHVTSWLDKLSDSEREIFEERSAIMEYDGGLPRELAEIEAIKRIIQERIVPGKCDKCDKVNGCMFTRKQRKLCEAH